MVELVLEKSGVNGEISVNQLSKDDRKKLVETIKKFRI